MSGLSFNFLLNLLDHWVHKTSPSWKRTHFSCSSCKFKHWSASWSFWKHLALAGYRVLVQVGGVVDRVPLLDVLLVVHVKHGQGSLHRIGTYSYSSWKCLTLTAPRLVLEETSEGILVLLMTCKAGHKSELVLVWTSELNWFLAKLAERFSTTFSWVCCALPPSR